LPNAAKWAPPRTKATGATTATPLRVTGVNVVCLHHTSCIHCMWLECLLVPICGGGPTENETSGQAQDKNIRRATRTRKSSSTCKVTMFYACNGCGFGPLTAGADGANGEAAERDLKFCGKCRDRSYCSRECQLRDWPRHKQDCRRRGMTMRDKRKQVQ